MKKFIPALAFIISFSIIILPDILDNNTVEKKFQATDSEAFTKEKRLWEHFRSYDPAAGRIPRRAFSKANLFVQGIPVRDNKLKSDKILAPEWRIRGPKYTGGRTRALALDILNEDIILAGGVSSGMWRSEDAGKTWQRTTAMNQTPSVSCIAQDVRPGKENIWYYGTGELYGNSADIKGNGVFKSTDGGKTWFLLESTASNSPQSWNNFDYIWSIVTNPAAPDDRDEVYIAFASGGIARSTDGGNSWNYVLGSFGNKNSYFTDLNITSDGVFYATMSSVSDAEVKGIFRSEDGLNWTDITPSDMPGTYRRFVSGISPSNENIVFFIGDTPGSGKLTYNSRGDENWHTLYRYEYISGDGTEEGGKWENLSDKIPEHEWTRGSMNSQRSYDLVIEVKPDNPDVVFIGGVTMYRYNDGFESGEWDWIGGTCPLPRDECDYHYRYDNHHADLHTIIFSRNNPDIMFTGSDGGVHKTLECTAENVEWISLNDAYYTTQFYTVAIDHADNGSEKIIGGLQDNGTLFAYSSNTNIAWSNPSRADGFHCAIADGGTMHYASQNTNDPVGIKMWKAQLDEFGEVIEKRRIDPMHGVGFMWNTPFCLDPNDNRIMYVAGGEVVWRNSNLDEIPLDGSTDSTDINWDSIYTTRITLDNPIVNRINDTYNKISAIAVSSEPANILYYGNNSGEMFRVDDPLSEAPEKVTNITGADFPKYATLNCIAIDPRDASRVIAAFSNFGVQSMFYTTDAGVTWEPIGGNLEEYANGSGNGPMINYVEIIPQETGNIYLTGTSSGLYSTAYLSGMGTIWMKEAATVIGDAVIHMLDVRTADGFTAVGTHGNGIYSAFFDEYTINTPGKPELSAPADNSRGILDETTLSWNETNLAFSYNMQVSDSPGFKTIIHEEKGVFGTTFELNDIEQGTKDYYWRVRGLNSGGYGEFSEIWKFTSAIAAPVLVYPEDREKELPLTLELKWQKVEGAVSYSVEIAETFTFNTLVLDTSGISGNTLSVADLKPLETYYWRVKAYNEDGESLYSEEWNFKTQDGTSVEDNQISNAYLYQNYPNPFSIQTNIDYILEKPANIKLALYNTNGEIIRQLVDGYKTAGRHSVAIDSESLLSGSYYYVLEVNGRRFSKKC